MKSRILRILGFAMVLSLLVCVLPAHAANDDKDGWVSITIGDENALFDRKNVEVDVYLIATGTYYGDWTMLDAFSDIVVYTRDDGSATINKKLTQISQRIADRKIKATQTGKSDENGKVEIRNLPRGIYYVELKSGNPSLTFSPMLLSAPNKDGSVQIRAVAKFGYVTPTPSPTPTPRPTPTPYETLTPPITVPPTPTPRSTPTPTPDGRTPVPPHAPTQTPRPGETPIPLEDYETALGLGNIQMHVGVCFE
jgi:hypothetical protein